MTKIGIISDIHSALEPLQQALEIFNHQNVSTIICAGDIAGYGEDNLSQVVELLKQNRCIAILGNHDELTDLEPEVKVTEVDRQYLQHLPEAVSLEVEDRRLFIVHAHPPNAVHGGIKLLDQQGEVIASQREQWNKTLAAFNYDVLIVGHTHQVFAEKIANTLVINPGSSLFNHSCMILTLPEMTVDVYCLGNEPLIKSWNWGLFYQQGK